MRSFFGPIPTISYPNALLTLIFFAGTLVPGPAAQSDEPSEIAAAAARLKTDLSYLASDELAGRGTGSEGNALAGEFIAKRFQELGFQTDAFDGTPFQNFGLPGETVLADTEHNTLDFKINGQSLPGLTLGTDFNSMTLGSNGKFSGQVAFTGYGISAGDLQYDDFGAFDVKGKVVIVLRKEPQQEDAQSVFDGKSNSAHALFITKEQNAANHGVAAMIIANDFLTVKLAKAKLQEELSSAEVALKELENEAKPADPSAKERLDTRLRIATQLVDNLRKKIEITGGETPMAIDAAGSLLTKETVPTVYCTRVLVDKILQAGCGKSLSQLEQAIDTTGKPQSVLLDGVEAQGEVKLTQKETPARNVIAVLPGAGALKDEYVVVGAHYDHVGMGGVGSLAPGTVAVHNGADDNASGTVTMLEVARKFSELKSDNRRSVIFMAFSAEELGLLGSAHYVRNPRWPLENTVAMLNLDMVGRLLNDDLTVYGTGTATEFPDMIDRLNSKYNFKVVKVPQGRGASDHAKFYDAKIPVFHFFTGLHNEYHRPADDVELINIEGMERISRLVFDVAREIAETPLRPQLLEVRGSAAPRSQVPSAPKIGIQLARGLTDPVIVRATVEGGPAEMAGLKSDDLIVSIDNIAVNNIGDFRNAMAKLKIGQTVPVGFKRGENTQTVDVKLGE